VGLENDGGEFGVKGESPAWTLKMASTATARSERIAFIFYAGEKVLALLVGRCWQVRASIVRNRWRVGHFNRRTVIINVIGGLIVCIHRIISAANQEHDRHKRDECFHKRVCS
jgi:hypothetical protein